MYFTYKCCLKGTLTIHKTVRPGPQSSDNMLAYAAMLSQQGFDVTVLHGDFCTCHIVK